MHITKPGPITDRILMLGREESCVYLIKGEEYTIIGGGLIYIVPDVLDQLKSFGIDESRITRLLILHSHFDHVGIVSYLQKRLDHLKVCASPRAKELLAKPKVVETIKNYNQGLIAMHKMEDTVKKLGITADKILVDEAVSGGDKVNWGGVDFEIIDAPGHSSCSIGAYMPKDKTLFASDAGGIPFGGEIFASGNSNFTKYQETLERFAAFDVEIHCAAH
jgi:glyoxylase-like metal-dependent hydrolase (beta-lactamase superfamily II)